MPSPYYVAAYTDSGRLVGCQHQHRTVVSAVACITIAGGYVIAVEHGEFRKLNIEEEKDFQFAMYGWGKLSLRRFIRFCAKLIPHLPNG